MRAEGAVLCCSSALAPAARPCPRPRRCPAPARRVQVPHRPPRPPSRPRKAPSPRAARLAIRDGAHPCPLAAGRKVRRPLRPPPRPRPRARRRGRCCQGCARPADGLRDVTHPPTAEASPHRPRCPPTPRRSNPQVCHQRARAKTAGCCTLGFVFGPLVLRVSPALRCASEGTAARRGGSGSVAKLPPPPNPSAWSSSAQQGSAADVATRWRGARWHRAGAGREGTGESKRQSGGQTGGSVHV